MRTQILPALAAVLLLGTGCSQRTLDSANQDAQHDISTLDQKAQQAAHDAKPQIDRLNLGARVTAAITANQNLRGTSIRVDAGKDGVRLRGSVKTAAQKQLAGRVAQDTLGPDKTVTNELSIGG